MRHIELLKRSEACNMGRVLPAIAGFDDGKDHEPRIHVSSLFKLGKARKKPFL